MDLRFVNYAISLSVVSTASALAFYLLLTNGIDQLFGWKRTTLIIVLFLYASFRVYRVVNDYRKKGTNDKA